MRYFFIIIASLSFLFVDAKNNQNEVERILNYKISVSEYHIKNGEDSTYFQKIDSLGNMLDNYIKNYDITEEILVSYVFYAKSISSIDPIESIRVLKDKIEISHSHELLNAKANALHELAKIYFSQRLVNKALESYMLTSKTFLKLEDWNAYAYALIDIGNVYYRIEEYDNALPFYKKAKNIFLTKADKEQLNYNLAVCYNNFAQVAWTEDKLDSALYFYRYAFKLRKEGGYKSTIPHSLYYISYIHTLKQNFDSAEYFAKQAIDYSIENNLTNHISFSNYMYGRVLRNTDTTKAIQYLKKAMHLADKNNDVNLKMTTRSVLGKFYIKINTDSADFYLNQLYYLAEKYENVNYKLIASRSLAKVYDNKKEYKKKAEFLEILNKLNKEKSDKTIMKSKFLYEQDQWLMENSNLKLQSKRRMLILVFSLIILGITILTTIFIIRNRKLIKNKSKELEKVNTELKRLIDKRDMLYSIIAHDLKGPIGSSEGILNLINNNELEKEEVPLYLKKLEESLSATFSLLNNLLSWVHIKKGIFEIEKNYYQIALIFEEIKVLFSDQLENKDIKLINEISTETKAYFDLNSISTVFRNIISNAIKFSYQGSIIKISTETNNNYISVFIEDNGIGMDENTLKKLFKEEEKVSKTGTNNEKGSGFGLVLTKELININNGEIKVKSTPDKGSTFIVKIPKSKSNES